MWLGPGRKIICSQVGSRIECIESPDTEIYLLVVVITNHGLGIILLGPLLADRKITKTIGGYWPTSGY